MAGGFTLVELLITVAILGVVSAVAIPSYLGVVDRTDRKAKVAEVIGLAKECAAANAGGSDGPGIVISDPRTGRPVICGGDPRRRWRKNIKSQKFAKRGPVDCLGQNFANAGSVWVRVEDDGRMRCIRRN
ncbi:prepilin-type N-terminal cleavage/methylation domain-containing protein [Synechococcus sp. RSCCF101]|uniref:type IV pilin protein n=1 Tax=Synechococcus sp. RSCCF101 TaxID=2511069 RepID=UPI0012456DDE|nr:prepilin-type N-terminal cleavage/methylation domain-containing protein [Synechococcus sp. RSCCF101]QEY30998.1 prepilin-type N-terminal cleavage/methylation domain-containing protein [Synechococcus sp. RSCCF101]